jgi:hypothetical protein
MVSVMSLEKMVRRNGFRTVENIWRKYAPFLRTVLSRSVPQLAALSAEYQQNNAQQRKTTICFLRVKRRLCNAA